MITHMCRLYGFRSAIFSGIQQSLVAAENALARQSEHHSDGWGVAYYVDRHPHVIRNDKQALNDELFRDVSGLVTTRTFLAHIRKATHGDVRVLNSHPFQHGAWTFAHNGEICDYVKPSVREAVLSAVDRRFRRYILGTTDSETIFFLALSQLARRVENIHDPGVNAGHVIESLQEAFEAIMASAPDDDHPRPNRLNFLITNGIVMVGTCFRRSLYYSTHKTSCPERSTCFAYEASRCEQEVQDGIVKHLIISSEPVAQGPNVWNAVQDGEYVAVDHGMNFRRGWLIPADRYQMVVQQND